jgi:predicted amidohydrolase YtcJ
MWSSPTRAALALLTVWSGIAIGCSRPSHLAADLVVTHASIWTGSRAQPSAAAVAIIGDRIVDVGNADEIDRWRGANTTVIDAEGRRVVPGFNDAHVRLLDGATRLENVDLSDAGSPAEFARRINERAKARPGEWIVGGDWDERQWTPPVLPTRYLIDDLTNSSPVFVVRADGRMALANAAALGRAGITETTSDPPGGTIVRGANGFPTGVLQGAAMDAVLKVVPPMTPEQRLHAVKRALELAASLGVTSAQDINTSYDDIAAFADLANRGELTARISTAPGDAGWYDQAKLGVRRGFGSVWLRIGAVRARVDGVSDVVEKRTRLMAADHAGLQVIVDSVGDGPASRALDLFDDIARANGGRDRRFRIDTSRIVVSDLDRLAALDAIASLAPHASGIAFAPLIEKRIRVSLGSGWPAAPLNPMVTIGAAIARGLSPEQALSAYTNGSAFAEFQETEKGTIARGMLADLVMLSDDILAIPAERIKDVQVLTTIVGGKIVHQRKP